SSPAIAAVLAAGLGAGCAPQPPAAPPLAREAPAEFPAEYYAQAAAEGRPVYRIDPARSLVVVEVRRGGSLAKLRHDHVVASHEVTGCVASDRGRADLYIVLDRLVVDEPALRAEAGFDTQPAESDIAGTRRNMLDRVLDAGRHPYALIRVNSVDGDARMLEV